MYKNLFVVMLVMVLETGFFNPPPHPMGFEFFIDAMIISVIALAIVIAGILLIHWIVKKFNKTDEVYFTGMGIFVGFIFFTYLLFFSPVFFFAPADKCDFCGEFKWGENKIEFSGGDYLWAKRELQNETTALYCDLAYEKQHDIDMKEERLEWREETSEWRDERYSFRQEILDLEKHNTIVSREAKQSKALFESCTIVSNRLSEKINDLEEQLLALDDELIEYILKYRGTQELLLECRANSLEALNECS